MARKALRACLVAFAILITVGVAWEIVIDGNVSILFLSYPLWMLALLWFYLGLRDGAEPHER